MKNIILTIASVATLAGAANAQTYGTYLNWSTLGANAATVASSSGQTFTDIGTTLGINDLVGYDLNLKYVYSGSSTNRFQINGSDQNGVLDPALPNTDMGIWNGTVTANFSSNALLSGYLDGGLSAGEKTEFSSTGIGSFANPPTGGLGINITGNSVENTTGSFHQANILNWDVKSNIIELTSNGSGGRTAGSIAAAAVPEPSSATLLGLGALGLLVRRKK